MKNNIVFFLAIVLVCNAGSSFCQQPTGKQERLRSFGIKGGLNFINIAQAQSINGSNRSGFMAGVFYSPYTNKLLGWGTELIYSRQGYNFKTNTTTGVVKLNYILVPLLNTFNITRYFQLYLGGQIGILLHLKVDSSSGPSGNPAAPQNPADYFNNIDWGFICGIQIHPGRRLMLGGRLNANAGSINKMQNAGIFPSYIPGDSKELKSNVMQFYIGYYL